MVDAVVYKDLDIVVWSPRLRCCFIMQIVTSTGQALNSGDDEKVGSKDEKVGSKDEKLGSKESPAEPVSPKTRSLRRPLPGLLADLEGPPTAPSVEHPMTPATSPECLEAKPLASSLQKGPRHRKMLPGLEQSERTEADCG